LVFNHGELIDGQPAKGWNLRENVITSEGGAEHMTGNIGLVHAYCSQPTMALDVDDLPQATVWLAARGVDLDELLTTVQQSLSSGRSFTEAAP
jgi:hypothetical protein